MRILTICSVMAMVAVAPIALATSPSVEDLENTVRLRAQEAATTKGIGGDSPMVIPAAAFATNGNYEGTYFFHPFEGNMRGKSATDGCVQAPVYLPEGATIYQIYASILDEDAGEDVYVSLVRSDNYTYHDADTLGTSHTNGSSATIQTIFDASISHPLVKYPRYHYWVQLCLPSADTKLYSVRVYFTDDGHCFSDAFESGGTSAWSGVSP